jgi:hypothetical protein
MVDVYRTGNYYAGGIAKEVTPGTYVSPVRYLPYSKLDFEPGITDEPLKVHTGRRGSEYKMMRTKAEPKGSLQMPAWPENGLEDAFLGALGGVSSAQQGSTSAYQHTFTESNSLPTFSITKWAGSLQEPQAYTGCTVNSLKLDYASGSPVNMSVEYVTNSVDFSKSTPTQTYASTDPFTFNDFTCKLGDYGVAPTANSNVTKASIEIKNNIKSLRTANKKMEPSVKVPGQLEVTGRIEFPFGNLDEYRRYLGGSTTANTVDDIITDRAISLQLTGANIASTYNYDLTIDLPRVNLINLKPDGSGDDTIMYGFDFRALYDNATGSKKMISSSVTSKLITV